MDKSTAQRIVASTFKAGFDRGRFRDFINELCNGFDESKKQAMQVPDAFKPHVTSCQRLGTYESPEGELADILIVHLTESYKLERTRTALRDFVAHKLKREESYKEAGLVAFVSPDSQSWRFSFVRMEYETKRDPKTGKIKPEERLTPARRFSYLVGAEEECHTAQTRFLPLLQDTSNPPVLARIEEAFSVESVTKEFFNQYAALFKNTHEALDAIIAKDKVTRADLAAKHVSTVDFAKKLLGQIVFLYFIQKKGWLGVPKGGKWGDGPKNFMRNVAQTFLSENPKGCLFNDLLEPLFYRTLATDRSNDDDLWEPEVRGITACRIPFLNGGLFEPLAGYDWQQTNLGFSNTLFTNEELTDQGDTGSGILDVFDRYNFTVNESEPLEIEVAIDPEMLGKVFENLIEENRRKGLGAFYTPREIVHYKCQQALILYLNTALNQDREIVPCEDIRTLIHLGDKISHYEAVSAKYDIKMPKSIETNARIIDEKLASITVCDPAVGSGAYPVGMMHEIVRARSALTPYFNTKERQERTPYIFKRHAIQNSLYGVDVDVGAVEIAKLRLWLSLVVDEEETTLIKPLPNLDFKIVVGNSLLGVDENELANWKTMRRLEALKPLYFDETDHAQKEKLKIEIGQLILDLTNGKEIFDFHIHFSEVFHRNGGFNIMIVNPPYLGEKGHKETFRLVAASPLGRKFYTGKMDLFYFFFHLALNLAAKNGVLAFITTNYFITATGAKVLRNDIKKRATVEQLINFNEVRIFETAQGQHNMITILQKGSNPDHSATTCITSRRGFVNPEILTSIVSGGDSETEYFKVPQASLYDTAENYIKLPGASGSSSNPLAHILAKMRRLGRPLESIMTISTGIQTGADKLSQTHLEKHRIDAELGEGIFVISAEKVRSLKLPASEKKMLKPWFKNSDVSRWTTSSDTDQYLIFADKRLGNLLDSGMISAHLRRFKKIITECSSNAPYLHRPRRVDFNGPKLVVPQRSMVNTFAFSSVPWYASVDVYYITDRASNISNLKAILALLNSRLYYLWFYHEGKRKGEALELYQKPLSETPIPELPATTKSYLVTIVDKILLAKQRDAEADTSALEREIDELVYSIYNLTPEEIAIVESSAK